MTCEISFLPVGNADCMVICRNVECRYKSLHIQL